MASHRPLSGTDVGRLSQITGWGSSTVIWHASFWMITPPFCLEKGKATGVAGFGYKSSLRFCIVFQAGRQAGTHTDKQQRDTVNQDPRRLHHANTFSLFLPESPGWPAGSLCNHLVTSFHFLCTDPLSMAQFRKCEPGLQPSSGLL